MEQPNIFDYATSELSQDAFICYLLEYGKEKYKKDFPKEYQIAHSFLERCGIVFDEEILEVKKQYLNIDVLVVTSSNVLIIEDKTGTGEHSGQIVRYFEAIKNDTSFTGKEIKVCYLKTMDYVWDYKSDNKDISCCSLRRKDLLELLEKNRERNLIFDSFYMRLYSVEQRIKNCDDNDIKTWIPEKWFEYLSNELKGHNFDIGKVNNARGGFYACWFDWSNIGSGEKYKQIEISFQDNKTSEVKLCFKFNGGDKETTINSEELIKDLQSIAVAKKYTASNRKGRTTTYAYKTAENKADVLGFIND